MRRFPSGHRHTGREKKTDRLLTSQLSVVTMHSSMEHLRTQLNQHRVSRGMSWRQYAELAQIDHGNLYRMLTGRQQMTFATAETICQRVGLRLRVEVEETSEKMAC